jgi:phosphoadenosine phosphosulfate reductase
VEWDSENSVIKLNPLAHWASDKVWDYIHDRELPYNPLHDEGYPSIGCIHCTQPVNGNGKDKRAGRWSGLEKTECGIHWSTQTQNGG